MNLFTNPTYNGKFIGPNSAKPIAGICLHNAYKRPLQQVKVADATALIGYPVEVTNKFSQSGAVNAGTGLAANVMNAKASATRLDGFLVMSPNTVLMDGDDFPKYLQNQIVNCAMIGSGAEIFLPADHALNGTNVSEVELSWDKANKKLVAGAGDGSTKFSLGKVNVLSQLVEGIMCYEDGGVIKVKETPVILVKL